MESASAASSAGPPLDWMKAMFGSPTTAPSRVKLTRTVNRSSSCGGRHQEPSLIAMSWTRASSACASAASAPKASARRPIEAKRRKIDFAHVVAVREQSAKSRHFLTAH